MDTKFHKIVYGSFGIFDNYVLACGNDTAYIILKTHKGSDGMYKPGDSIFYYIIDIKKYKAHPDQERSPGLLGPFDEKSFLMKKQELHIENIVFTMEDRNA